jgi:5-methylcytosine-specific restriction endonuclease McrA
MGRATTSRTATAEWKKLRIRVLRRDPRCRYELPGCTGISTIADHIIAGAFGGSDDMDNLAGICASCSAKKSSAEGHHGAGHNVSIPQPKPIAPRPIQVPRRIDTKPW